MMVGHAMLAFAVAASLATRFGWTRERALALGVVAGAFATLPDVDMTYAALGGAEALVAANHATLVGSVWGSTHAFWADSVDVHRTMTHSLVVAVPTALAATWIGAARTRRALAVLVVAGLVVVADAVSGPLGASVMVVFAGVGLALGLATRRYTEFSDRTIFAAAFFGMASHPFGDLFTGHPPAFFYPFDVTLVAHRVALLPDPTLNLLAIFAVELTTIWLAVTTYARLTERSTWAHVDARAVAGVAYAIAVVAIPAPTLHLSYPFVFSVLAVGLVGITPRSTPSLPRRPRAAAVISNPLARLRGVWFASVVTGLAAVTLAAAAYTVAYLVA